MINSNFYSIDYVTSAKAEHDWERYYKLKEGDVFVEVGAFWGRYAIIANKKRCSKIILIEPSPANFRTIENLINTEYIKNTCLIKKAVTNKKTTIQFNITGNSAGHRMCSGNFFVDEVLGKCSTITTDVEADTLDNILEELDVDHVDLLACDCEGEEAHMLEGSTKYLTEKKIYNVAIGAYHHFTIKDSAINLLTDRGYKNIIYEEGVLYANV